MNTNPHIENNAVLEYLQKKVQQQALQIIKLECELAKTNAINDYHVGIIQQGVEKNDKKDLKKDE